MLNLSSTEFHGTESSKGMLDPLQETSLLESAHEAHDGTNTNLKDSQPPPLFSIQEEQLKEPSPLTLSSSVQRQERNEQMVSSRQVEYDMNAEGVALSMPVTAQMHTSSNSNQLTYYDGYDSDGKVGPFYDVVVNELDSEDEMCNEEEHGEPDVKAIKEDEGAPDTQTLTEEDIKKMTVAQLKEELHKRKQSVNGKK